MAADYYDADTENGDHIDDPSEDALFMLLEDLDQAGNTFVTVNPADGSGWYASVTLLGEGSYEVVRHDADRDQHELDTATSPPSPKNSRSGWPTVTTPADRPTNPDLPNTA